MIVKMLEEVVGTKSGTTFLNVKKRGSRADVNQGVVRSPIMPNGFLCYRNHALMTGAVSLPAALAFALY